MESLQHVSIGLYDHHRASWNTTSSDWNMMGVALTGTTELREIIAPMALGPKPVPRARGSGTQTVTVTSSAHNNSKYLGFSGCSAASPGCAFVKGANYTNVVASTHNGVSGYMTMLVEISINPVSPAANTVVNSSSSTAGSFIDGIEILGGP